MQAEMASFSKMMLSNKSEIPTTPPEPFIRTSTNISRIAIGDTLNVTATENIKKVKEFTASEIQITPKMVMPGVPVVAPIN